MITLPIVTAEWNICTPVLFRFMDGKYVDAFFEDGSLRLSSFAVFRNHKDEQRLDEVEGRLMFVHKTEQGGGQTIEAQVNYSAMNLYVFSTSMRCDSALMTAFKSDSYIRINDSTKFGIEIAKHIPGVVRAFEGPCLYQTNKIMSLDSGYIDIGQFRDPRYPQNIRVDRLKNFVSSKARHYPLFLKHKSYAHQSEYRFVWLTNNTTEDFLDIKVPGAIQFCEKPSSLTE